MSNPQHDGPRRAWRTDAEWTRLSARIEAASHSALSTHATGPDVISIDSLVARRWPRYVVGVAAASMLLAASLVWRARDTAAPLEWKVTSTRAGERTTIVLDDSTLVRLGPATTLGYAANEASREVQLDGLADFTVTHNARRPFRVRVRNALAIDLGTEFVVRAYATDSSVSVSVVSGTVSLRGDSSGAVTLRAGDVGRVAHSGVATLDAAADAAASAAWTDGRLLFTNRSLDEVAMELSRWFGVTIVVPDRGLGRRRVTALYTSPALAGVLDALTATLDARYEREGDVVTIQPVRR